MRLEEVVLKKDDIIYFKNGDTRTIIDNIEYKIGQISSEFFLIADVVKIKRSINGEILYNKVKH